MYSAVPLSQLIRSSPSLTGRRLGKPSRLKTSSNEGSVRTFMRSVIGAAFDPYGGPVRQRHRGAEEAIGLGFLVPQDGPEFFREPARATNPRRTARCIEY